jgi:ATP-dependent Clp protease ATP-binding subunit ClpB
VQLKHLEKRLAAMEMGIEFTDAAVGEIAKAGFDPVYGARPLKRAIQQQVENPLSKAILEGKFGPKDTIRVDVKAGGFVFEKGNLKRAA